MGHLYRLIFPSGKFYIGITGGCAFVRARGHIKAARLGSKTPVARAIRRYRSGFLVEVIAHAEKEELPQMEIEAIKKFRTLCPFGYNLSHGGDISPMHNPEVAKRVSAKLMGHSVSVETRAAISRGRKGKMLGNTHLLGRRWTLSRARKRQLSDATKRMWETGRFDGNSKKFTGVAKPPFSPEAILKMKRAQIKLWANPVVGKKRRLALIARNKARSLRKGAS